MSFYHRYASGFIVSRGRSTVENLEIINATNLAQQQLISCMDRLRERERERERGGGTPLASHILPKMMSYNTLLCMYRFYVSYYSFQYSSLATDAFFKYGGEPHFIFPTTVGPATQMDGATVVQTTPTFPPGSGGQRQFLPMAPLPQTLTPQYGARTAPSMQQTPTLGGVMGGALGGALIGPEVKMSGRHNGLYRYLARLLRPMWYEHLVVRVKEMNADQVGNQYIHSGVILSFSLVCQAQLFNVAHRKVRGLSVCNIEKLRVACEATCPKVICSFLLSMFMIMSLVTGTAIASDLCHQNAHFTRLLTVI